MAMIRRQAKRVVLKIDSFFPLILNFLKLRPNVDKSKLNLSTLGLKAKVRTRGMLAPDAATITRPLSICPGWRYTLPSAERSLPLLLLVVVVVDVTAFVVGWQAI
jgi:hypothetical protein